MESLLLKSIKDGRLRQTGLLLKVGKDANEQDKDGENGLMKAMALKNAGVRLSLVKLLLRNKADVTSHDTKKRNAFMWACYHGRTEEIKYMTSACDVSSLQIDSQDDDGNTAVLLAVQKGHAKTVAELVRFLQESGMQSILQLKNNKGSSPLMVAFRNGNFEIAKCLITDGKVKIDELTYNVLYNENFKIGWSKTAPQKLMKDIMKNLSEEYDPDPSNILKLLITNESFRNVALKVQKNKEKEKQSKTNILQVPRTAPAKLRRQRSEPRGQDFDYRKSYPPQNSIKRMLPTIMNMYEEQLCENYRPASKNNFIPYSSMSRQLQTMATTSRSSTALKRNSKSNLGNLPDFGRLKRIPDTKFNRVSRSTSVQLPELNSWSLLRRKLRGNLIKDL